MFRNLFFIVLVFLTGSLAAQQLITVPLGPYPGMEYDGTWERFSNGDFDIAMQDFAKILARRTQTQKPWIDSICYFTMIGECQFQAGNYPQALEAYDQALNVYFEFSDWPTYLDFSTTRNVTAAPRLPTPWGISNRTNLFGNFSNTYHIKVAWNQNVVQIEGQVGLMQQDMLIPVNAPEIFCCLARAIRHRAEILGPMSKFDPLSDKLVEVLAGRPGSVHWSGVWSDVLYGLALAAAGKDEDAFPILERASMMPGQLEHHLTATALCEMAGIKLRAGKKREAATLFYEAGISAYFYNDPITLEESFRYSAICQRLIDRTKPCVFLVPALNHSVGFLSQRKKNACANHFVLVSLMEEAADEALTFGNLAGAKKYLADAEGLMKVRALKEGRYGGRWNYLQARAAYLSGRPADLVAGNKHLNIAMEYMNKCSLWVSQIKYLAFLHSSGNITTSSPISMRKALELYDYLLREPTAEDWIVQPMDSLAVQVALPPTPTGEDIYELWFDAAANLSYTEQAFEISERIRRKRFYSQIPLGSRLISLRAIFESPASTLSRRNQLDRQELSRAFPEFAKLSQEARTLRTKLQSLPSFPLAESLYGNLEKISVLQEIMLRSIALSRTRSPIVFPPLYSLKEIQDQLPENTAMLVFFAARGRLYGFMINRNDYEMWPIATKIDALRAPIAAYLAALGNTGPTKEIAAKDLRETQDLREGSKRTANEEKKLEWKKRGNSLFKILLQSAKEPNFTELVVVPDNVIWYIPFESLCVADTDGKLRPFIAVNDGKWSLRYAPTASLGLPTQSGRGINVETVVVAGKLFPKDDAQKAWTKATEMSDEIANLTVVPSPKVPNKDTLFASQLKQLVVLSDIPQSKAGPLAWNPFGTDAKLSSGIASWLDLPWGGPRLIVLPGFHSSAENANAIKTGNGSEIFFSILAMQANGAHTILLSRWNQGGTTSYDLVGEFLRNDQKEPAPKAWKNAVMSVASRSIKFDEEPRIKTVANEEPLKANHPFFWSGFLLVDQGELPAEEDEPIPADPEKGNFDGEDTAIPYEELKKEFGDSVEEESVKEPQRE